MRIAVTRAREGAPSLVAALREAGYEPVEVPLVRVVPLAGPPVALDRYDWLVLTSARAVELLVERASGRWPRVAAVGAQTARELRSRGVEPDIVADRPGQEGLVEALRPHLRPGERILFAGAEGARGLLARELAADVVHLYRTVELEPAAFPQVDLVLLASPSAARAFARLAVDAPCVTIGPITSGEARRLGLRVAAEATRQDPDGVVDAVRLGASRSGSSRS